jgi:hypothetical protein
MLYVELSVRMRDCQQCSTLFGSRHTRVYEQNIRFSGSCPFALCVLLLTVQPTELTWNLIALHSIHRLSAVQLRAVRLVPDTYILLPLVAVLREAGESCTCPKYIDCYRYNWLSTAVRLRVRGILDPSGELRVLHVL